ncbi:MAG TPA: hypothetical protein VD994_17695 [Prosthecobacter sp.]|nr:hypothetical protein [Prosthecobacter sp.]
MKTLVLWLILAAALPAAGQMTARVYEDKVGAATAAFPDAERPGSPLHERVAEVQRELERKGDPLAESAVKRVIIAVRAAAALQKERPEAAPNALEVTERSLGVVEKTYGNLSDPGSAFAKAFWQLAPEVRAQLPDFNSTGAWPLAAGAMAEFKLAGKDGGRTNGDFGLHQSWMAVSGLPEWPPRERPASVTPATITQTGADTWQSSDGVTITRTGPGKYQVKK